MKPLIASPIIIPLIIRLILVLVLFQFITQCAAEPTNKILLKSSSPVITTISKTVISSNSISYKGKGDPIPVTQLSEARQKWLQILENKIQMWKAKNVTSYEITVSYQKGFWQPNEVYTYKVKNGEVIQESFEARECESLCNKGVTKSGKNYATYQGGLPLTVDRLFEVVRSRLIDNYWNDDVIYMVNFEPEYGFPRTIHQNSVRMSDVYVDWEVVSFKVL